MPVSSSAARHARGRKAQRATPTWKPKLQPTTPCQTPPHQGSRPGTRWKPQHGEESAGNAPLLTSQQSQTPEFLKGQRDFGCRQAPSCRVSPGRRPAQAGTEDPRGPPCAGSHDSRHSKGLEASYQQAGTKGSQNFITRHVPHFLSDFSLGFCEI